MAARIFVCVALLWGCAFATWPYPALAQMPAADKYSFQSSHGVDPGTGQFTYQSLDIAVGTGAFPARLEVYRKHTLDRLWITEQIIAPPFAHGGTHSLAIRAICSPCDNTYGYVMKVDFLNSQYAFDRDLSSDPWVSHYQDGATLSLVGGQFEVKTRDGLKIVFAPLSGIGAVACGSHCYLPLYIESANGDFAVYSYDSIPAPGGGSFARINSIVNSKGFGLSFSYVNPSATSGDLKARFLVSGIQATRTGCVASTTVNCSSGIAPQVSYQYTNFGPDPSSGYAIYRFTSFTNGSATYNYSYNSAQYFMTSMARSDAPLTPYFVNTYHVPSGVNFGSVVSQADALGRVTLYGGGPVASSRAVTTPDGQVTVYKFGPPVLILGPGKGLVRIRNPQPSRIEAPLGRVTVFTYDNVGRLLTTTRPEGDKEERTLDSRGNITTLRRIAKPGSGIADQVATASYPACTASNYRICNRPSYVIDPRGNRIDYQYDNASGALTVSLAPADDSNFRAVTRLGYAQFSPVAGLTPPLGVTFPQAWEKVTEDACLVSGVTGTTINFSYVCPAASLVRKRWRYVPSTAVAPTSHELEATIIADGVLNLETTYTYDGVGNVISTASPRALQP